MYITSSSASSLLRATRSKLSSSSSSISRTFSHHHPSSSTSRTFSSSTAARSFYSPPSLNDPRVNRLPYSIRILLESAIRNCDNFQVTKEDVEKIIDRENSYTKQVEIPFKPARVLLQDFTGVPAVVDLACMRDAMNKLGGDSNKINPLRFKPSAQNINVLAGAGARAGSRIFAAQSPVLFGVNAVRARSLKRSVDTDKLGLPSHKRFMSGTTGKISETKTWSSTAISTSSSLSATAIFDALHFQ
ncbi:hypothetical protein RIF29_31584 [Crotalaria pallida]|uniref:Aconitase/3-isopropylmalate dehydratase large subunit alpha/beta/alpha domain-containing protein n=1 Tax=Crotalaria pallida TaxID=3830 RepID=A0AAN9HXA2_CROPI